MERKNINDIHFSVRSVLVDNGLKNMFFRWIAGNDDYKQIDWLSSPISKTEFPDDVSWDDIISFSIGLPFYNNSLSGTEGEILRLLCMETAENLFDKFLHEGLSKETIAKIENNWNQRFNSFEKVDYDTFDYTLEGFSGRFDGKKFVLHEQQKKGIAFLCTKGNGLLAYDVGVGKTATGIGAVVYQLQNEKCQRPLIVVPKAVYTKWIHDTKELFPNIRINELDNLNKEVINDLRTKASFSKINNILLPKNTISICTAEALEKIYYTEDFLDFVFSPNLKNMLSLKTLHNELLPPPDLPKENYVLMDELGVDLVLVDEAHRYKNLIRKVRSVNQSVYSKLGIGEPSLRAIKMIGMTEYVHSKSKGKNVFFLTATPFTNSPMEIYSMLVYVSGKEIRNLGFETIEDFLNEFAEVKIEWTVNNKNELVQKTVMKNFRSLYALQQIIQNYIDKIDAEDANIKRPEKETHVLKIEMTELQNRICEKEIHRIAASKSLGDIFKGMNNLRMNMISPALVKEIYKNEDKIKIPELSQMIESSPKLTLVCNTVVSIYNEHPDCGQIIYLPRGVKESAEVKKFLIEKGIPLKAIAMINSRTTELQKQRITTSFNDPLSIVKILIGSESISEGVDLNGNTLVLYNCMLGWNPTEPVQVEGRLWRQGNRQKKVHIVYPLIYNSIDSLIYQKHDEKVSRIDALWSYRGDKLNVEEINPAELKFDLIKSAEMKAEIMLEEEILPLRKEIKIIDESCDLINSTEKQIASLEEEVKKLEQHEQELIEYKNTTIANAETVPKGLRKLNALIIGEIDQEMENNKYNMSNKKRSLTSLSMKLNKKLTHILGENFTTEQKSNFILQLQDKKAEIHKKMDTVYGKKEALIRLLQAQYEAEEKADLHSVPKLTEELTKKILGE